MEIKLLLSNQQRKATISSTRKEKEIKTKKISIELLSDCLIMHWLQYNFIFLSLLFLKKSNSVESRDHSIVKVMKQSQLNIQITIKQLYSKNLNPAMHHQSSIRTEYEDEEDFTLNGKEMASFDLQANRRSKEDIYVHKLESLIKEHITNIKLNKPKIEELQYQRKFFKRICEKQKQKIETIHIAFIREEYEKEMADLKSKRSKLHEMIANIHDEAEEKKCQFLLSTKTLNSSRQFLQKSYSEISEENKSYLQILKGKEGILRLDKQKIEDNLQILKEKEKVEEKYKIILAEIQSKEAKKKNE